jgi:hypothetical protein
MVMLNIVRQEHGKKVEELTYEHCNSRTSHGRISTFRRQEKCLLFFFFVFLTFIIYGCFYAVFYGQIRWIGLATRGQFLVLGGTVFPALMCSMYCLHRYEYNANKNYAWTFFAGLMLV